MASSNEEIVTLTPSTRETLSRIMQAAVNDSVCLTAQDKAVYERLVVADELLKDCHFKSNEKRAEALAKKFGMSVRNARKDIAKAAELFNMLDSVDVRTGARILVSQIDQLMAMCLDRPYEGYVKDVVSLLKLKKDVYADLCKGTQIDPRMLQQNVYFFGTGSETAKAVGLEAKDVSREGVLELLRQFNISKEDEERIMADAQILEDDPGSDSGVGRADGAQGAADPVPEGRPA